MTFTRVNNEVYHLYKESSIMSALKSTQRFWVHEKK